MSEEMRKLGDYEIIQSIYMLMSRCGLDANEHFDREDFEGIINFNTPATINALGIATSDISEMALKEISLTIPIRQIPSLCDCDEHKRVERYAITCHKAESDNYLLKISGSSRFRHNPQRGQ